MEHADLTIHGNTVAVPLTRGKFAMVDRQDWSRLQSLDFYAMGPMKSGQWYAAERQSKELMHRLIMRAMPGELVDHVENDGLDNRRRNLRKCTVAENQANRHARLRASGIKGVHWHKAAKKWCAQIRVRGKKLYLGLYPTEREAADAYDAAAKEQWGEFANTNQGGPTAREGK